MAKLMTPDDRTERIIRLRLLLQRCADERRLSGYRGGKAAERIRDEAEAKWMGELALLTGGQYQ